VGGVDTGQAYRRARVAAETIPVSSNFIHQRMIEKKKQTEIIYNKHQNRIDMQDYQAYVAYKINSK